LDIPTGHVFHLHSIIPNPGRDSMFVGTAATTSRPRRGRMCVDQLERPPLHISPLIGIRCGSTPRIGRAVVAVAFLSFFASFFLSFVDVCGNVEK